MSTPLELSFVTLDVFTTKRFEGNPLAIVHVPAGVALPQATKQTVAREFNFSETVFLHESADGHNHPVDIFTVDVELPFAGHPTIGTASHVLGGKHPGAAAAAAAAAAATGDQGSNTALLAKAGRIPIERVSGGDDAQDGAALVVRATVPHDVHVHAGHLRTAAGIDALRRSGALGGRHNNAAIEAAELDAPVVSIVRGMTFVLVLLPSLDLLGQVGGGGVGLDFDKIDDLQDKGPWHGGHISLYYYVVLKDEEKQDGTAVKTTTTTLRTRMIGRHEEDPATGSAACTLASYLTLQQQQKEPTKAAASSSPPSSGGGQQFRYDITQGVEMGRRSEILVEVQAKAAGADGTVVAGIETVYLGGSAVEVTRGTIRVQ